MPRVGVGPVAYSEVHLTPGPPAGARVAVVGDVVYVQRLHLEVQSDLEPLLNVGVMGGVLLVLQEGVRPGLVVIGVVGQRTPGLYPGPGPEIRREVPLEVVRLQLRLECHVPVGRADVIRVRDALGILEVVLPVPAVLIALTPPHRGAPPSTLAPGPGIHRTSGAAMDGGLTSGLRPPVISPRAIRRSRALQGPVGVHFASAVRAPFDGGRL
jgi:hypothetical protein